MKLSEKAKVGLSDEVRAALADSKPVVALESTIISHGMPYPQNVETALRVEKEVRANGAVPATIAIIGGKLKAGLSESEIDAFGKRGQEIAKVSRRDIPVVSARGLDGATTVAATMIISELAGIRVFATGGIGGVHRGAERSFDISADLEELSATSVAVVCAGAKSILDLPKTLEYLETSGVPVIGFGTDEFPAFYTPKSGLRLELRADDPAEIAAIMKAKWDIGLEGGVVIANPIPEKYGMDPDEISAAIEKAVGEAQSRGISGKAVTPFLLARIKDITGGESLESNIALVLSNACLASKIASAYSLLAD